MVCKRSWKERAPHLIFGQNGEFAFTVLLVSLLAPAGFIYGPPHGSANGDPGRSALTVGLVPVAESNSTNLTPCGVFQALYPASLPYYSNYSIMFESLCRTPTWVSLYTQLGPGSFVVGSYWYGEMLPNLTFMLDWVGTCTNLTLQKLSDLCATQAVWIGFLQNNSVIGPYFLEHPEVSTGTSSYRSTAFSLPGIPFDIAVTLTSTVIGAVIGLLALSRARKLSSSIEDASGVSTSEEGSRIQPGQEIRRDGPKDRSAEESVPEGNADDLV